MKDRGIPLTDKVEDVLENCSEKMIALLSRDYHTLAQETYQMRENSKIKQLKRMNILMHDNDITHSIKFMQFSIERGERYTLETLMTSDVEEKRDYQSTFDIYFRDMIEFGAQLKTAYFKRLFKPNALWLMKNKTLDITHIMPVLYAKQSKSEYKVLPPTLSVPHDDFKRNMKILETWLKQHKMISDSYFLRCNSDGQDCVDSYTLISMGQDLNIQRIYEKHLLYEEMTFMDTNTRRLRKSIKNDIEKLKHYHTVFYPTREEEGITIYFKHESNIKKSIKQIKTIFRKHNVMSLVVENFIKIEFGGPVVF